MLRFSIRLGPTSHSGRAQEVAMKRALFPVTAIALVYVAILAAPPAEAQPTRVFVAAQGLDTNPCTFAQPCRTFQKAHDTVAAGGEIDVLDPAGYGTVLISKAISIQGHGFAGIAGAPPPSGSMPARTKRSISTACSSMPAGLASTSAPANR